MPQQFVITLTLTEDVEDRTRPDLTVKTDAKGVTSAHFSLICKTLKDLTIAPLQSHLQVSADLAETAIKAAESGAFDEDK